ncbi:MAG: fibronectin type III domain-containing protein [Candidatus Acidiferrales bacterium]
MLQRPNRSLPAFRTRSAARQTRGIVAFPFVAVAWLVFWAAPAYSQVSVLTQNSDNARDGVYNETILTPTSTIHKLFTITLDSPVMGQALVLGGLNIPGEPENILLAATSPNGGGASSAWAFNADTGATLWQLSLGTTVSSATATPVLDPAAGPHGALFVLADTTSNQLHAIDAIAGTELPGSPVTISATVGGDAFNSAQQNDRAALLELNGVVYAAFSHNSDSGTYHGWVIGYHYTGSGFTQTGAFCDTCAAGGNEGGIWQGGDGLVSDGTSVFAATGNGSIGSGDYSMSVVKLNPSSLGTVADSFLPPNAQNNSNSDADLNGGGMALMPGTGGKLFQGPSKYGSLYLLDSTNLAGGALQTFSTGSAIGHSPVAWNSGSAQYAYIWAGSSALDQFCYDSGTGNFNGTEPCQVSSLSGGGTLAISSNPTGTNAILWAYGASELHAINPANVSAADYWNSNMTAGDSTGSGPGKFQYVAVANGKVYVPSGSTIIAYGIPPGTPCGAPTAPSGLGTTAVSSSQINLAWTASSASCSITYSVFRGTTSGFAPSAANQIATGLTTTTYSDTGLAASTTYYYLVEGVDTGGTSTASNQASATTQAPSCATPTAPSGLGAAAVSTSHINLSWTASSASCSITYSVFRSTTSGFTPSAGNQIATGVTMTTYSDTGLAASTTYYYLVEAVDTGGTSAASNQASATTQQPAAQTFTLTANPTTITIAAPGQSGSTTLTFTAANGFSSNGSVTLSSSDCSDMPSESTCSFNPSTITLTANGTMETTLTVATTSASAAIPATGERPSRFDWPHAPSTIALACIFWIGIHLLAWGGRPRRWGGVLILAALAFGLAFANAGCAGHVSSGGGNAGTPVGDTAITVTFTINGVTQTVPNLMVDVQ